MSAPILLLNCGSSSIKYKLIDLDTEQVTASGLLEKIGEDNGILTHEVGDQKFRVEQPFVNHVSAIQAVVNAFNNHGPSLSEVKAVGHRMIHGGETFRKTIKVNDDVLEKLHALSPLAPLHNPPAIAGIEAARGVLPQAPHFAIFDTAFFSALPAEAYTYAIGRDVARNLNIRRYGFHGTSHSFVSKEAAKFLNRDYHDLKQIVCHLGNGASISAIDGGQPIDTSMGLTPLEGLVMGTRSGDVDPGIHAYLGRAGHTLPQIDEFLNKKSGMLGLCGSSDMRDVDSKIIAGDQDAKLALDIYVHRLVHYIGAYIALLGGLEALTFTGGVGENDANVRKLTCQRLAHLGFNLDLESNKIRSKESRCISTADSIVKILVIPTNEELEMARDLKSIIQN